MAIAQFRKVGDFDARVHRECVGLVAAHKHCVLNAAKEPCTKLAQQKC